MMCLAEEEFKPLENKWLQSYDIFQTYIHNDQEIEDRYNTHLDSHIFRLAHALNERGISFKGITSAKHLNGKRIAAVPDEENLFYVGEHNSFRQRSATLFSLRPEDKRRVDT